MSRSFLARPLSERKTGAAPKAAFFVSRRGLCTILRSAAGGQDTVAGWDRESYRNNAHWLRPELSGDSNYACYYDAASLYPSSGESKIEKKIPARRAGS